MDINIPFKVEFLTMKIRNFQEKKKLIKDAMVSVSSSEHHMFSIPLEVNINSGNNWGEAH